MHSLIQIFDSALDAAKMQYADDWTAEAEINLQAAKLYLYGIYFVAKGQTNPTVSSIWSDVSSQLLLHGGLRTAARLIYIFSTLEEDSIQLSPGSDMDRNARLLSYPKHYFRTLMFAVVFLFKFLAVNKQASDSDKDLALNSISTTHRLFKGFVTSLEHLRVARSIEFMGRIPGTADTASALHVDTRLGASILYDYVWRAAQLRNRPYISRDRERETSPTIEEDIRTVGSNKLSSGKTPKIPKDKNEEPQDDGHLQVEAWEFPWSEWDDRLFDDLMTGSETLLADNDFERSFFG
jgi:hypothetical protein